MTASGGAGLVATGRGTRVAGLVRKQHVLVSRLVLLAAVFFGLGLARSGFVPSLSAWGMLQGATTVGFLGMAIGTTIVAGELDLSVAAVGGLSAIVAVKLLHAGLIVSVVGAIGVGAGIGLLQGLTVAYLPIQSIVLTLGTMVAWDGAQLLVTSNGQTVVSQNLAVVTAANQRYWIFTPLSLALVLTAVALGAAMHFGRFGSRLKALGASRKEALLAGVKRPPTVIAAFAISGTLAGAAGVTSALSSASAVPDGLDPLLLSAISVALIGGVALRGGRGGPLNVLLGALIVVALTNELAARGASGVTTSMATAGLLIMAVLVEIWTERGNDGNRRSRRAAIARSGKEEDGGITAVPSRSG